MQRERKCADRTLSTCPAAPTSRRQALHNQQPTIQVRPPPPRHPLNACVSLHAVSSKMQHPSWLPDWFLPVTEWHLVPSSERRTMKGIHSLAALLLLVLVQSSWQIPEQDTEDNSRYPYLPRAILLLVCYNPYNIYIIYVVIFVSGLRRQDLWLHKIKRMHLRLMDDKFVCNFSLLTEDTLYSEPMKRHSEGTFSNDYSKYLESRRAQDFVQWLMNSKRSG